MKVSLAAPLGIFYLKQNPDPCFATKLCFENISFTID